MLTKYPSDTYSVRSDDVRCRPLHVEVAESHFHWVFVTKAVEGHVSLFHKEMKFVLLPSIGELLQKTGVGSIDWTQGLVVKVRAFGQRRFMGCLVTGKDLRFFVSGKDRGDAFSQHSIDLGLGNLVTNTLMGVRQLMRNPAVYGLQGGVFDAGGLPVDFATDVTLARLLFAG